LEAAICNSSAIAISDGSYMPHHYPVLATAAWIVTDGSTSMPSNFSGVCTISGPPSLINAYRAELQGLHAVLVALEQFYNHHHITSSGVTIGCDNQGALSQAQHFHEHVPCAAAHADLIRAITALRLRSPITLTFVYVPGHQDALTHLEELSSLARLNVWADAMAKKELHQIAALPHRTAVPNSLLREHWYALAPSGKITLDPHPVVVELLGRREALWYWSHKQQLDATSFDLVHWELLDMAT